MQLLNRVYIKIYFLVLLLYVFFNKGVAYSYMAEILLVAGIFILFINRKNLELGLDTKQILVGVMEHIMRVPQILLCIAVHSSKQHKTNLSIM